MSCFSQISSVRCIGLSVKADQETRSYVKWFAVIIMLEQLQLLTLSLNFTVIGTQVNLFYKFAELVIKATF